MKAAGLGKPAPFPLYPRDTHCKEITAPTELFRAALSVSFIINMQIAPGSKLPTLQHHLPPGFSTGFVPVILDSPGLAGLICL